ncbi:MAG TPA: metallophosphoesterase family protein [Candidatus Eisenbacteria bacterium]|jgi:putative phosphoesterase
MRIAALYDVHGNLDALDAVLAEIDRLRPDLILLGGDIALGPMPRQTLDRLIGRKDAVYIRGNADRELVEELDTVPDPGDLWAARGRWARDQLTPRHRAFLAHLPATAEYQIDPLGAILFCHGSPRSDEEIITRLTPESRLQEMFAGVAQPLVVCGHTHVQFDRQVAGKRLVNPGSVGMPYEGSPDARWALFGPAVELRRTPYDSSGAAARLPGDFPGAEEFARKYLLHPPTASEASEFFERMAERRGHGE